MVVARLLEQTGTGYGGHGLPGESDRHHGVVRPVASQRRDGDLAQDGRTSTSCVNSKRSRIAAGLAD